MDTKPSAPPHVPMHGIPATNTYQHAVGLLAGVHMAPVVLDHFDGRAHLLGQDIDIDTFAEAEGAVGVAEAIGRSGNAVWLFA